MSNLNVFNDLFIVEITDFLEARSNHVLTKKEKKIVNENNCMYRYAIWDGDRKFLIGSWNMLLFVLKAIGVDYDGSEIVPLKSAIKETE